MYYNVCSFIIINFITLALTAASQWSQFWVYWTSTPTHTQCIQHKIFWFMNTIYKCQVIWSSICSAFFHVNKWTQKHLFCFVSFLLLLLLLLQLSSLFLKSLIIRQLVFDHDFISNIFVMGARYYFNSVLRNILVKIEYINTEFIHLHT